MSMMKAIFGRIAALGDLGGLASVDGSSGSH
jgi:hypothetical protein